MGSLAQGANTILIPVDPAHPPDGLTLCMPVVGQTRCFSSLAQSVLSLFHLFLPF